MRRFCGILIAAVVLAAACMKAPLSERIQPYSAESPATGPAGVPGSGGTGAAGSFGSGGTAAGTTEEGAHQTKGNVSSESKKAPIADSGFFR